MFANKIGRSALVLLMVLISITAKAQWYDPEKVNKKAGDIYARAYEDAQDQKYDFAIDKINKALAIPATRERIEAVGAEAVGGTPQKLAELVDAEIERWTKTLKPILGAK